MTIAFNSTTESGFIKNDFDQISAYLSGADDSTTLEARLDGLDTTDGNLNTAINNLTTTVSSQRIHRKVYTSAAEISVSSNNVLVDTEKTFNLIAPINSLIIGINYKCEMKKASGTTSSITRLKINGTNLGTTYVVSNNSFLDQTNQLTTAELNNSADNSIFLMRTDSTNYMRATSSLTEPLKILDTTTTFTIQLATQYVTGPSYLKNVVIEVIYIESFVED